MTFDLTKIDLALLNSMTKYPSIPTYHTLDPKNGALSEPASAFEGDVIGTEKVDGTNSRIILTPDGRYLICESGTVFFIGVPEGLPGLGGLGGFGVP